MLLDTFKIVIVMYGLALLCYQGQRQALLNLSRYFIAWELYRAQVPTNIDLLSR